MNLYVAGNGRVVALDGATGSELWRTDLPRGGVRCLLVEHEGTVFVTSNGRVFALNARSGRVLWENGLKGLGYGDIQMSIGGRHTVLLSNE